MVDVAEDVDGVDDAGIGHGDVEYGRDWGQFFLGRQLSDPRMLAELHVALEAVRITEVDDSGGGGHGARQP